MKSRWIIYLLAGVLIAGLLIFSTYVMYNVVVYKVPVLGPKIPNPYPSPLNHYQLVPVNHTGISADDPIRKDLLTENEAWEYAWVISQQHCKYKIFLPLEEKTPKGLSRVTDNKGNSYVTWEFYLRQNEFPFLQSYTHSDTIYVDAHDGRVLWCEPVIW